MELPAGRFLPLGREPGCAEPPETGPLLWCPSGSDSSEVLTCRTSTGSSDKLSDRDRARIAVAVGGPSSSSPLEFLPSEMRGSGRGDWGGIGDGDGGGGGGDMVGGGRGGNPAASSSSGGGGGGTKSSSGGADVEGGGRGVGDGGGSGVDISDKSGGGGGGGDAADGGGERAAAVPSAGSSSPSPRGGDGGGGGTPPSASSGGEGGGGGGGEMEGCTEEPISSLGRLWIELTSGGVGCGGRRPSASGPCSDALPGLGGGAIVDAMPRDRLSVRGSPGTSRRCVCRQGSLPRPSGDHTESSDLEHLVQLREHHLPGRCPKARRLATRKNAPAKSPPVVQR
mmetsp:Transcript_14147/g.41646  ORF Transcript_14147/g.41646 Transcript_14147/m.41646 type:complete len:339 (-) Transcript_14147:252-1268(-)